MAAFSNYAQIDPLDWLEEDDSPNFCRVKRSRVAIACQRCKGRKQKCNGSRPSCDKCRAAQVPCEYPETTNKSTAYSRRLYVKALEERVAQLEMIMSKEGLSEYGRDHWDVLREPEGADTILSPPTYTDAYQLNTSSDEPTPYGEFGGISKRLSPPKSGEAGDMLASAMRDLSLQANGGYVGASAYLALGRVVGGIVSAMDATPDEFYDTGSHTKDLNRLLSSNPPGQSIDNSPWIPEFDIKSLPAEVADRLLHGYLNYIPSRWPILHRSHIMDLHSRRNRLENVYESFTLTFVYAIGGRYLNPVREDGESFPIEFFTAALKRLDIIIGLNDIRSVVCLLLLCIFSLKGPSGPSVWTYVGIAMRMSVSFGFHRDITDLSLNTFDVEMRRRVFWSCYLLDRHISIATGRPFAISDQDIDCPLPTDIDDENVIAYTRICPGSRTPGHQDSSMSCFIRQIKLQRIESRIQQTIYRVDQKTFLQDSEIDAFLDELTAWRRAVPRESYKRSTNKSENIVHAFGNDLTLVGYNKAIRLLLYPQLFLEQINLKYITACANACAELLEIHKRRYTSTAYDLNLIALNSVYTSGLTLIYCIWISPQEIFSITTSSGISACSIVLHVMAERWQGVKKYCDSFEFIRKSVLEFLGHQQKPIPRQELPDADPGMRASVQNLLQMDDQGKLQCLSMLDDIIGFSDTQLQEHTESPMGQQMPVKYGPKNLEFMSAAVVEKVPGEYGDIWAPGSGIEGR